MQNSDYTYLHTDSVQIGQRVCCKFCGDVVFTGMKSKEAERGLGEKGRTMMQGTSRHSRQLRPRTIVHTLSSFSEKFQPNQHFNQGAHDQRALFIRLKYCLSGILAKTSDSLWCLVV